MVFLGIPGKKRFQTWLIFLVARSSCLYLSSNSGLITRWALPVVIAPISRVINPSYPFIRPFIEVISPFINGRGLRWFFYNILHTASRQVPCSYEIYKIMAGFSAQVSLREKWSYSSGCGESFVSSFFGAENYSYIIKLHITYITI